MFRCSLLIVFVILHRVYARDFSRVLFFFVNLPSLFYFQTILELFSLFCFVMGLLKCLRFSDINRRSTVETLESALDLYWTASTVSTMQGTC